MRFERRDKEFFEEIIEEIIANEREPLTRALGTQFEGFERALAVLDRARKLAGTTGVVARMPFDIDIR